MGKKKGRKRPEQQIYRPGMGLNKTVKNSGECQNFHKLTNETVRDSSSNESSNCSVNKDTIFEYTTSLEANEELPNKMAGNISTRHAQCTAQNYPKNRRPDIQVYVPRPKVAAKLEELSNSNSPFEIPDHHIPYSVHKPEKILYHDEKILYHDVFVTSSQSSLQDTDSSGKNSRTESILRSPHGIPSSGTPLDVPVSLPNEQTIYEPVVVCQDLLHSPDVPKILVIPAVVNEVASPLGDVNYFSSELLNENKGYIPPPQPSAMAYQYLSEKCKSLSSISSENLSVTCSPQSMLSHTEYDIPIPPPAKLSGIIPSPSLPFLGGSAEEVPISAPGLLPICDNHLAVQVGTKRLSPFVKQNLLDISILQKEMSSYLSEGLLNVDQKQLNQCRLKLQLHHENIILEDPDFCVEKNVDESLWNLVFFQIIESLRKAIEDQPLEKGELTQTVLNIVHQGTIFYENLLEEQQEKFKFNLTRLLSDVVLGSDIPESIRVVLVSCQKIFIYLGDLAFYKEEISGTSKYGKARSLYLKAQQIEPKNERPYSKLAIIAQKTGKKLDAVYYYMRSLAASNPFLSSKKSLLFLFHCIKKKAERKHTGDSLSSSKMSEMPVRPNSIQMQQSTQSVKHDDDLEGLSTVELNKRFIISFLNVHGKLLTMQQMETFADSVKKMLKEFHALLQHIPLSVQSSRLLQIMVVNMFSVENVSPTDMSQNSSLQQHALNVILAMVSVIMEHCCTLYKAHLQSPEYPSRLVSHELAQLLPAIKVWTDWVSCHKNLLEPPFVQNKEYQIGYEKDVWFSFAKFMTTLQKIDTGPYETTLYSMEGYEPLVLEEDADLIGFVPLCNGTLTGPSYVKTCRGKSNAKNFLRVIHILSFGDNLCGISTPFLEFNVRHKKFTSLVYKNSICTEKLWTNKI